MRLAIIINDNAVYIDNTSYFNLDLSFLPTNVSAFQWYDTYGEIEFKSLLSNDQIIKAPNEIVRELPEWANLAILEWTKAKDANEAAQLLIQQTYMAEKLKNE